MKPGSVRDDEDVNFTDKVRLWFGTPAKFCGNPPAGTGPGQPEAEHEKDSTEPELLPAAGEFRKIVGEMMQADSTKTYPEVGFRKIVGEMMQTWTARRRIRG